jgi:uncharacterized protein (DUF2062 family)
MNAPRLKELVLSELRSGLSTDRVALAIALGIVIGVFPVFGTTTLLCFVAAVLFRLNHVLIQAVNYLVYPLFFALMIPFIRGGDWLFGVAGGGLTVASIRRAYAHGPTALVAALGAHLLHGVLAWLVVAPVAVIILRHVAAAVIRRVQRADLRASA